MKKISILSLGVLLTACANTQEAETQSVENADTPGYTETADYNEISGIPCSCSCSQNNQLPCPCVENKQKPRVTEMMPKKRPCCDDDENLNAKEVIPDAPEIYVIAANRTLRSMLNNGLPLPEKSKIFVADTINNETDMPTGIEKGTEAIKRELRYNGKYIVVDDREKADYVFSGEVSWYDTATKTVPAIKYSLGLFNNHGQKIGEWVEILHQANGDRSWW